MKDIEKHIEELYKKEKHREIIAYANEMMNDENELYLKSEIGRALNNIGNNTKDPKRFQEALAYLLVVDKKEEGKNATTKYRIAYAYYRLNDEENAIKHVHECLSIDKAHRNGREMQGLIKEMGTRKFFVENKKQYDMLKNFKETLTAIYENNKKILPYIENVPELSKEEVEIGMLLLDIHPDIKEEEEGYYYSRRDLSINNKRFLAIQKICDTHNFWEKSANLMQYFFEDKTYWVKSAWALLPNLMYQIGWQRRSFRAPNLEIINFVNQLNFISDLITGLTYRLTLEEYILYSDEMYEPSEMTYLWASAINEKDEKITNLLLDIVYNRHETLKVNRTIIKAMLISENEECWEAVGKLLLSAQRQEGLRQTIVEALDETSLGAFIYILRLIQEHNLARFSAVVRALDTWAGLGWEAEKQSTINRFLELALYYLENPENIQNGILSKDNAEIYMALWAQGVFDIEKCVPLCEQILSKAKEEKTLLVLLFLKQVEIPKIDVTFGLKLIKSDYTLVFLQATQLLNKDTNLTLLDPKQKNELFEYLEKRLSEAPEKPKTKQGLVFSWSVLTMDRNDIYALMLKLVDYENEQEIDKITAYFSKMAISSREKLTEAILPDFYGWSFDESKEYKPLTQKQRDFAFMILKDRGEYIRKAAIRSLKYAHFEENEMLLVEDMLKRKSAEVRKNVIMLLLKQDKNLVKDSTQRLLEAKNQEQRLAGLDLLVQLKTQYETEQDWINNQAQSFVERAKVSKKEQVILDTVITEDAAVLEYKAENGFGLFDPTKIAQSQVPTLPTKGEYIQKTKKHPLGLSKTPEEINQDLQNLHDLFIAHQDYEYSYEDWNNAQVTVLLGNNFRAIKKLEKDATPEERFHNYPLAETWKKWFEESQLTACDLFLINFIGNERNAEDLADSVNEIPGLFKHFEDIIFLPKIPKVGEYYWQNPLFDILENLEIIFPYKDKIDFLEGFVQTITFRINQNNLKGGFTQILTGNYYSGLVNYNAYSGWSMKMSDAQFIRFWKLEKYLLEAFDKARKEEEEEEEDNRYYRRYYKEQELSDFENYVRAYSLQLISKDEILYRVMQEDAIRELTRQIRKENDTDIKEQFSFLKEMLVICRDRILEIELKRGDSETAVTHLATELKQIYGIENYVNILTALDKENLHRGYVWRDVTDKKTVLSQLLRNCNPTAQDTQKDFDTKVKEDNFSEKRLAESAMYAPQWIPFVAEYLKWKNMASAIWWLHAHTNGRHDTETESEISKYSAVPVKDFQDGAVDTDWFQKNYKALGKQKWEMLYDSAKYVSEGTGHRRAMLYADVILGKTKITEIKKKISEKRNQDYVRVYGLVPLQRKNPEKDLLNRYQLLQKFKKESKKFGSQRQASEGLAVRIAMENLARTAGYSDPIRLTWAMESKEAKEILAKAEKLTFGEVSIALEIDAYGKSRLKTFRGEKELQSIPSKYGKDKSVKDLKAIHKTLSEQYKRTRKSLEVAMVNGDEFTRDEIQTLAEHPVVSPMLKNLVLYTDEKLGFYQEGNLVSPLGGSTSLGDKIRIAHCSDLYKSGEWSSYQKHCFDNQIVQVFRQIFRELYIPTEDELKEKSISRRYAGHQVQPKKTVALLKTQGWTVDYEEGLQKTFHKEGYIAKMYAMADWFSPADVESPTLETVEFINRETWKNVPFAEMNPRIFSEVMRDIDLVVSVAHVGEVDPEASQSSIELRAVLLEETLRLFKLKNVKIEKTHALIEGKKNNYSVHLGSAIAHKVPGVYLSILPVHSQHRGRLFLPFLDEDPKTAELMSKVLLLAKDDEINDPTVLRQLT